jgi:hypothetical protein
MCRQKLFEGELYDECSALGDIMFDYYFEQCMCDVAAENDPDAAKYSVCTLANYCILNGVSEDESLLGNYCHSVGDEPTTTTTPPVQPSIQGDEGRRRFVWEYALVAGVCILAVLIWLIVVRYAMAPPEETKVIDADFEPVVIPRDRYLTDGGAYVHPLMDVASLADSSSELPLVGSALFSKNGEPVFSEVVPPEIENYQANADNSMIELGMFDMASESAAKDANVGVDEIHASERVDPLAPIRAVLAGLPWTSIKIQVQDLDVSFYVDGKLLRTNRLPEPLEDIHGDGVLRIGQRMPNLFGFTGEITNLKVKESEDVLPNPDDPMGPDRRPPRAKAVLIPDSSAPDLLSIPDNPFGAVKTGSTDESWLFDGKYRTYLDVPTQHHPRLNKRTTHFEISADVKQMPDTSGYIVAKTDHTGTTRYWALAMVSTPSGMSIQFFYRPQGSTKGHRITVANQGVFGGETMDNEFLITGHQLELDESAKERNMVQADGVTVKKAKSVETGAAVPSGADVTGGGRAVEVESDAHKRRHSHKRSVEEAAELARQVAVAELAQAHASELDSFKEAHAAAMAQFAANEKELQGVVAEHERLVGEAARADADVKAKDAAAATARAALDSAEALAQQLQDQQEAERGKLHELGVSQRAKTVTAALSGRGVGAMEAMQLSLTPAVTAVKNPLPASESGAPLSASELVALLSLFPASAD